MRALDPDKSSLSLIEIPIWTKLSAARQTLCVNAMLFFVGLGLSACGLISPPVALLGGLVYGFTLTHPFHRESKSLAKFLLQAPVVGLGFGMNLAEVTRAGRSGFV